ncbi:glucose-1-phosphate thymidylyltransferase [Amycolatopsis sp. NPDC049688]|uniref:glucose-1-phosphate thymidylyltransferase n=1 Tax=Amycolatopsis sp. NPDC049688 TaxID=3154733 RepID=UPI0034430F59
MRALILAGGTGTRLRPFTHSTPKQLMPVANRPVLVHCLDNVRRAGMTEAGIVVSTGRSGEQIRAALGDGEAFGMRLTYIPQEAPLGLAHCVAIARPFLGDEDFVLYLGDNMLPDGIAGAIAGFAARKPDAGVLVTKVADPRQFGVVEFDGDGNVVNLVEKPQRPNSALALIGVYFFTARIHASVHRIRPSGRGELEIADAIVDLLRTGGTVVAEEYGGYWKDTGTVEDLLACNRTLLDGMPADVGGYLDRHSRISGAVVVERGASIIRSRLTGPAIIGAGAVITDSRIGPYTAVGGGCRISGADIADSIVLADAKIHAVPGIRDSLIGRSADLRVAAARSGHRLLVGDHARVEVAAAS